MTSNILTPFLNKRHSGIQILFQNKWHSRFPIQLYLSLSASTPPHFVCTLYFSILLQFPCPNLKCYYLFRNVGSIWLGFSKGFSFLLDQALPNASSKNSSMTVKLRSILTSLGRPHLCYIEIGTAPIMAYKGRIFGRLSISS